MTIIQAFTGAIAGTFADQWKDIVTAGAFDAHALVTPGVLQATNNMRGTNFKGSLGVLTSGSKIFVPENTAAFVFSQGGIEAVITEPGGYEYQSGQESIFNGTGAATAIFDQIKNRIGYGGQPADQKYIAFINLREIRGLRFGTKRPVVYNDVFYGADLEVTAFGEFSLRISNILTFVRNFLPANTYSYTLDSPDARRQVTSEFLQAFIVALSSLSATHRISQLPSQTHTIAAAISNGTTGAENWSTRFGLEVVSVGIESIEFTPESKELVRQYSENMMNLKAYEGISQSSSDMAAQQKIAQGIQDHGLGDGGGMVFGMNVAQGINPRTGQAPGTVPSAPAVPAMSFDQQIEAVKKLKDLYDTGILSQEEYDAKRRQIMGL